jgi:hypothetical protein
VFFWTKTYSAAVNLALAETLRVKKVLEVSSFFGSGPEETAILQTQEAQDVILAARLSASSRSQGLAGE